MFKELKKSVFLSRIALFLVVLGSVGLDQVTKKMAEKELMLWSHKDNLKAYDGKRVNLWSSDPESSVVNGKSSWFFSLSLNYVRNQGAAWGMLNDWDDRFRVPFFMR